MSGAGFGRRLLTVTAVDVLGAYQVLRVADPDGAEPEPGQFAMLAAAERWGGGEDERPYLPRAFSIARHAAGESHFLLEDVGPGSRRLCELRAGDSVWIQLTAPVASYSSKAGQTISALVLQSPNCGSASALPLGTPVSLFQPGRGGGS